MTTITKSIDYIIRLITGFVDPRKIIMLQKEVFLRTHLDRARKFSLPGKFRGRVGGIGDAL